MEPTSSAGCNETSLCIEAFKTLPRYPPRSGDDVLSELFVDADKRNEPTKAGIQAHGTAGYEIIETSYLQGMTI